MRRRLGGYIPSCGFGTRLGAAADYSFVVGWLFLYDDVDDLVKVEQKNFFPALTSAGKSKPLVSSVITRGFLHIEHFYRTNFCQKYQDIFYRGY